MTTTTKNMGDVGVPRKQFEKHDRVVVVWRLYEGMCWGWDDPKILDAVVIRDYTDKVLVLVNGEHQRVVPNDRVYETRQEAAGALVTAQYYKVSSLQSNLEIAKDQLAQFQAIREKETEDAVYRGQCYGEPDS